MLLASAAEQKPAQRFNDQHVLMLPHQRVLKAAANTSSDKDKLPPVKYSLQMIHTINCNSESKVSPVCVHLPVHCSRTSYSTQKPQSSAK